MRSVRGYTGNGGLQTTSAHVFQANTKTGIVIATHVQRAVLTLLSTHCRNIILLRLDLALKVSKISYKCSPLASQHRCESD